MREWREGWRAFDLSCLRRWPQFFFRAALAAASPQCRTPRDVALPLRSKSIDGLPQGQFARLVRFLSEEAKSRDLAVVTRDSPSQFRARGYASAQVRGKRTVIAWVWDIYDAQQQRALRVAGEQPSATKARGWAAADDQALRNIARESLTQLAGFLANPEAPPADPPGGPSAGTVVASTEPVPAHDGPTVQSLATFGGR